MSSRYSSLMMGYRAERLVSWTAVGLIGVLLTTGCGDSDVLPSRAPEVAVSGRVFSTEGSKALGAVQIAVGKNQTSSSGSGEFKLSYASDTKQASLEINAKQHAPSKKPAPVGKAYIEVFTKAIDASLDIDPKAGGVVSSKQGAAVQIKGESLTRKTGEIAEQARLELAVPDVKKKQELAALPGNFDAKSGAARGKLSVESVVFVGADEAGQQLKIRDGQTATVTLAASPKKKATSNTLFRFDNEADLWVEAGAVSQGIDAQGLAVYTAEVSELGWYSVGTFIGELTCFRGCILRADETSVPYARVVFSGVDLFTESTAYAEADGCFAIDVPARARLALRVQAEHAFAEVEIVESSSGGNAANPGTCTELPVIMLEETDVASACPQGFTQCGSMCVDPASDPEHCGACEQSCGEQLCLAGHCAMELTPDQPDAALPDDGGTDELDGGMDGGDTVEPGPDAEVDASGPDASGPDATVPQTLFFVDLVRGAGGNPGTLELPFRTITQAMAFLGDAHPGARVTVAPGTYNAAAGEVFPIIVGDGIFLLGDETNRGAGTTPTRIEGVGNFASYRTAVVASAGVSIHGIEFVAGGGNEEFGLLHELGFTRIAYNTFRGHGGMRVLAGNPEIELNTFANSEVGVHDCQAGVIAANDFNGVVKGVSTGLGTCRVLDNTFNGAGEVGIYLNAGDTLVADNAFNNPAGYAYGAVMADNNAEAVLRTNNMSTVTAQTIILTVAGSTALLDLGSALESGGNLLGSGGARSLSHGSTQLLTAWGNTWANGTGTPACGTDIVRVGDAGVVEISATHSCAP